MDGSDVKKYEDKQEVFFSGNPTGTYLASYGDALLVQDAHEREFVHSFVNIASKEPSVKGTLETSAEKDAIVQWERYFASVDIHDGRTPRERLSEWIENE